MSSQSVVLSKPAGHYDPLSLVLRLYEQLLANPHVQTGLSQVTKYGQPILTKLDDNLGEPALNFIEARLDTLLAILSVKSQQNRQQGTLTEKRDRIIHKLSLLTSALLKKVSEVAQQVQETKPYITLNNYLHLDEKIEDAVHLTAFGYKLVKESIVEPALGQLQLFGEQVKNQITIAIHGLDIQALKKRYTQLHAKYEVLQKCLVIVTDETVKLVFDKKALAELGENGRQELNKLLSDLKSLETDKIKQTGVEYYAKLLKKAQATLNTARQSVYVKQLELGNEVAANAVKPEGYAVAAH